MLFGSKIQNFVAFDMFFEFLTLIELGDPKVKIFFAIFRNLARNISPNYEANETKLGTLLEPPTVKGI